MSTTVEEKPVSSNGTAPQAVEVAKPQRMVVQDSSQFANLLDTAKYEHLWRVAQTFAASELVPAQFQKNAPNCYVAIQMAIRLGVDPFMFLQSCYVVHGRPGIEAKLAIALANKSGVFLGPIQYRLEGDGKSRRCTAYATVRETREEISMTVDWSMVEAEGWSKKAGSKWLTMPEVMFRYRSAMMLIRTHCPEVIMGMHSADELEDSARPQTITVHPAAQSLDALADRLLGEQAAELTPQPLRDPTGAHQDLPADHGKTPPATAVETQESATAEDLLTDLERELAGINKVTAVTDAVFAFKQEHPPLSAQAEQLGIERKAMLRGERKQPA